MSVCPRLRYKFFDQRDGAICSVTGEPYALWEVGKWQTIQGPLIWGVNGFHCATMPLNAFISAQGTVLAIVEVDGACRADPSGYQDAWERMRLIEAWDWPLHTQVSLALLAAEQVIAFYEQVYPQDQRLRDAVTAAQRYLNAPRGASFDSDYRYQARAVAESAERAAPSYQPTDHHHIAARSAQTVYAAIRAVDSLRDPTLAASTSNVVAETLAHALRAAAPKDDTLKNTLNMWMSLRIQYMRLQQRTEKGG